MRLTVTWLLVVLALVARGAEWWLVGLVVVEPLALLWLRQAARTLPPEPDWDGVKIAP